LALALLFQIGDNTEMAKKIRTTNKKTGLFHAREARGMSRTELVKRSGVSKQQLSRLENGLIRLRLDHLKPFAAHLDYTPEQMLLWGRYPGTGDDEVEAVLAKRRAEEEAEEKQFPVPELDIRAESSGSGKRARKSGRTGDPVKTLWGIPKSFVQGQLNLPPDALVVIEANGDSMVPTIAAGDRVIVDTSHTSPTPDGIYAIRDTFEGIVIKRLQLSRSARPPRVKIISDNAKHAAEEIPLDDIKIVGKAVCCLKLI
jgi:transcriptional regulator with XRE-family HTH domain